MSRSRCNWSVTMKCAGATARSLIFPAAIISAWHGIPRLAQAARAALAEHGLNVAASRRTTGNHEIYTRLETALTAFFGSETALVFPDGYLAPGAVTQTLAGEFTHAFVDEFAHGALVDAARMLDCPVKRFSHREAADLARRLSKCGSDARPIILTDGMFSHDGSVAPLREYLKILPRRGMILVDDAHGAGVLGATVKVRWSTPASAETDHSMRNLEQGLWRLRRRGARPARPSRKNSGAQPPVCGHHAVAAAAGGRGARRAENFAARTGAAGKIIQERSFCADGIAPRGLGQGGNTGADHSSAIDESGGGRGIEKTVAGGGNLSAVSEIRPRFGGGIFPFCHFQRAHAGATGKAGGRAGRFPGAARLAS